MPQFSGIFSDFDLGEPDILAAGRMCLFSNMFVLKMIIPMSLFLFSLQGLCKQKFSHGEDKVLWF